MAYLILGALLGAWVFLDSRKRHAGAFKWMIGVLFLGPVILPFYFAKRPLLEAEIREGGTGWNVLKNFALCWTLYTALIGGWFLVHTSQVAATAKNNAQAAGVAVGFTMGIAMIAAIWFFPMVGSLVLGFFLKKSSVVEKGPSGHQTTRGSSVTSIDQKAA